MVRLEKHVSGRGRGAISNFGKEDLVFDLYYPFSKLRKNTVVLIEEENKYHLAKVEKCRIYELPPGTGVLNRCTTGGSSLFHMDMSSRAAARESVFSGKIPTNQNIYFGVLNKEKITFRKNPEEYCSRCERYDDEERDLFLDVLKLNGPLGVVIDKKEIIYSLSEILSESKINNVVKPFVWSALGKYAKYFH